MQVGFAQRDITPALGVAKIGMLRVIVPTEILDPLCACAAVFESGGTTIGFISLDVLSIRWTTTQQIRQGIEDRTGIPGGHIMVTASHTHGGPPTTNCGDVSRDEAYLQGLIEHCISAVAEAHASRRPARIAIGRSCEFDVAFNRRVVMRDGTTRTHGRFSDPDALCIEGPIDPEVGVIAAQSLSGDPLGLILNFACHPTERCGDEVFTASWPGYMRAELADRGWPHALFLNGAAGDVCPTDPSWNGAGRPMAETGAMMAAAAERALDDDLRWLSDAPLMAARARLDLPYREPLQEQIRGTVRGAQRFVDPDIYDRWMPHLVDRIRTRRTQPAEVQAFDFGEHVVVSMPAELFSWLGLQIKERTHPRRTAVVGYANGMVGYVPHVEAFERGGYETTFAMSSRLAPEAGQLLVDAAVNLVSRRNPD